MKILITGSSGFLGSALVNALSQEGHDVTGLVRQARGSAPAEITWNPSVGMLDPKLLEGFDAVIHLAGESIAGGRWTPERKAAIRDSRVTSTTFLCEALAALERKPHTLLSASAVGYYACHGDGPLTEESPSGAGFLADVCRAWEAATRPAQDAGVRVAFLRSGVVLSPDGGLLKKVSLPFNLGLAATLGNGTQYMSWISLTDWLRAVIFLINTEDLDGPVNLVSPQPVTNKEFTMALAHRLNRPALLRLPAWLLKIILGELAEALLLCSQRVTPQKLLAANFQFKYDTLNRMLQDTLDNTKPRGDL